MKKYQTAVILLSVQILSSPLHAQEIDKPANVEQAKVVRQSLSAEQKDQIKTQAQEKIKAFQQLSPEQRQQKSSEFGAKFRARRAAH